MYLSYFAVNKQNWHRPVCTAAAAQTGLRHLCSHAIKVVFSTAVLSKLMG